MHYRQLFQNILAMFETFLMAKGARKCAGKYHRGMMEGSPKQRFGPKMGAGDVINIPIRANFPPTRPHPIEN